MTSDARFGIELYDGARTDGALEGPQTQAVGDETLALVGHVWSPDASRIVERPDGEMLIVDPGGTNPTPLNATRAATEGFLEAFRVFSLGDRPQSPAPLTVAEARARLAALQRGEALPEKVAPTPAPRPERARILRARLAELDRPALADGTWWSRILQRPEYDE